MVSHLRYLTQDCHPIVYKFYCILSFVLSMEIYFSLSFCIEKEFSLLTIKKRKEKNFPFCEDS